MAAKIQDALEAYHAKDYATARRLSSELADAGDAHARYLLGMMISFGEGGPSDPAAAAEHYRLAADAGHADAAYSLAALYALGRGVEKDYGLAMSWYQRAADLGDADALAKIGLMHANAEGVPMDLDQARQWWQRAADRGQAEAMRCLGMLAADGKAGLARDPGAAADWLLKAHNAGDPIAFRLLARLRPELEAAGEAGSASAQNALGVLLLVGAKRPSEALPWFERAAAQEHPESLRLLGYLFAAGDGVEKDEARAVELYRRGAEKGDRFAQQNLAASYDAGRGGLTRDVSQAIKWYRRAANQGVREVNYRLAELLAERNRDRRDANEAVQRLVMAASDGPAEAEYRIAAGDGSWAVVVTDRGDTTSMAGLDLTELRGLPDED
jgi:TPR repeat protein